MPNPLAAKLAAEIRSKGPIGFDEFMLAALYDPDYGYYMGAGQPEYDFRTAVDTHPVFAAMIARRLDDAWEELGYPAKFSVLELGSGRGSMASAVFQVARELPWGSRLEWTGVEIGAQRRRNAQLECPRARFVQEVSHAEHSNCGVIFANEFLDALPFKVARRGRDGWRERRVEVSGSGEFFWADSPAGPALRDYCSRWGGAIPVGGILEARLRIERVFADLVPKMSRALAVFIDYGGTAEQVHSQRLSTGTALSYRGMKVSGHLLSDPGRQDLTAHVNFDAVIDSGSRYGFVARTLVTQAEYLIDLGIGSYLPSLAARRSIGRFAYEAEREAVTRLLDPREMGSFRVLELERIPASERDGV